MKVSTRVEYGVLALTDIAMYCENGTSVSAIDIAQREGISKKYLEQILVLLRQAGLVKAQKGLHGGYTLSRPANAIKVADVLNALDGSVLEEMDTNGSQKSELKDVVNECLWGRINGFLNDFACGMTVSDFVGQCRQNMPEDWDMYVI